MKRFMVLASALFLGFMFAACDIDPDPEGGGGGAGGTISPDGGSLTLSGNVYTGRLTDTGVEFNRFVRTTSQTVTSNLGNSGSISNGNLSITIGRPRNDQLSGNINNVLFGYTDINVSDQSAQFAELRLNVSGTYSGFLHRGNFSSSQSGFTREEVLFIYADKAVTVTATGGNQTFSGVTLSNLNLNLVRGWNFIHIRTQGNGTSSTVSVSVANPNNLRWVFDIASTGGGSSGGNNDGGSWGDRYPDYSGNPGANLRLYGDVYKINQNTQNVTFDRFTGDMDISSSLGDQGIIFEGYLQINISPPSDHNLSQKIEVWLDGGSQNLFDIYQNVSFSNQNARFAVLEIYSSETSISPGGSMGNITTLLSKGNVSGSFNGTFTQDDIAYVYADTAVTVTGTGVTAQNGITFTGIDLRLVQGWNTVHIKIEGKYQTGSTVSASVVNDLNHLNLRWFSWAGNNSDVGHSVMTYNK